MKKTWKIVCIAFIAILIAILIINNNTSAYSINLSSSNSEVSQNEEFNITLSFQEATSINGYVSFDSSLFEFPSGQEKNGIYCNDLGNGNVAFMYYNQSNTDTITSISLKFKAKSNVTGEGTFSIVTDDTLTVYAADGNNTRYTASEITCTSVNVKIKEPAPVVVPPTLTPPSISLEVGGTQKIESNQTIADWQSSNTSIATVDGQGNVTAVGVGNATITATSENGQSSSVQVIVTAVPTPPVEDGAPVLSPTSISLKIGDTGKINTIANIVKWESSDPNKVMVDENGNILAIAEGTVTITATAENGKKSIATVTVVDGTNPVINPTGNVSLVKGETKQMQADRNVTWKSSDENVVTVDPTGKLTAIGEGTATITATDANGKSTSFTVTVSGNSNENESGNSSGAGIETGSGTTSTGNGVTSTGNTSSSANTVVPATGESTTETLVVLALVTLIVASIIFRRKSKLK